MIITARGEYGFTDPAPASDAWQQVIETIAEGLEHAPAPEKWTPENLIEKSGVTLFKVVPMTTAEFLATVPDIKSLLVEMASEKNDE